jgi:ABC-type antimicrobial peptide transport system permease subunit
MALGADEGKVRGLVMRQVIRMTIVGGLIGITAAIGLGYAVRSLLYGMASSDPGVLLLATATLVLVALAAGYIPALRASKVHPVQALRYE